MGLSGHASSSNAGTMQPIVTSTKLSIKTLWLPMPSRFRWFSAPKTLNSGGMCPCMVCTKETLMLGTRLCDQCWEAIKGYDYLMSFQEGKQYIAKRLGLE
jgi:hypothetical protein